MDMNDKTLVLVMTQGIGAHLTNDEKRAHLIDLKREAFRRFCRPRNSRINSEFSTTTQASSVG
jgi:hypothetical protein